MVFAASVRHAFAVTRDSDAAVTRMAAGISKGRILNVERIIKQAPCNLLKPLLQGFGGPSSGEVGGRSSHCFWLAFAWDHRSMRAAPKDTRTAPSRSLCFFPPADRPMLRP